MKAKSNLLIILLVSVLIFGGLIALAVAAKKNIPRVDYSEFITCMADKGTKFWGASWCPHCKSQKALFGDQKDQLEEKGVYQECSPDGSQTQTQVCSDAGIESYPTWDINGQRTTGEIKLEDLASATGCQLPQEPE